MPFFDGGLGDSAFWRTRLLLLLLLLVLLLVLIQTNKPI
jgi:hypothetical protein